MNSRRVFILSAALLGPILANSLTYPFHGHRTFGVYGTGNAGKTSSREQPLISWQTHLVRTARYTMCLPALKSPEQICPVGPTQTRPSPRGSGPGSARDPLLQGRGAKLPCPWSPRSRIGAVIPAVPVALSLRSVCYQESVSLGKFIICLLKPVSKTVGL